MQAYFTQHPPLGTSWHLKYFFEFFYGDFAVFPYLCKKTSTDCFTGMYWYRGAPAIGMLEKVVAALASDYLKPQFLKCFDETMAGDSGNAGHALIATR